MRPELNIGLSLHRSCHFLQIIVPLLYSKIGLPLDLLIHGLQRKNFPFHVLYLIRVMCPTQFHLSWDCCPLCRALWSCLECIRFSFCLVVIDPAFFFPLPLGYSQFCKCRPFQSDCSFNFHVLVILAQVDILALSILWLLIIIFGS